MEGNTQPPASYAIDTIYKEIVPWSQEYPVLHLHDVFSGVTQEEAYALWREKHWQELFDPWHVKILSVKIIKMEP